MRSKQINKMIGQLLFREIIDLVIKIFANSGIAREYASMVLGWNPLSSRC
jgi:hypothetical protein